LCREKRKNMKKPTPIDEEIKLRPKKIYSQ